jgi:hypothetical protein
MQTPPMSAPLTLDAVPETMLWTLYHRAAEARRCARRFRRATLVPWTLLRLALG